MNRRTERIGKLMQHSIGRILLEEMSDPRIDPARTSVTRVEVQEDLLVGKVYVSVLGSDADQRRTVEALNHAGRRIQALMRRDVSLRHMPALEFLTDQQFKTALKTWDIIRRAMEEIREKERRQAQVQPQEPAEAPDRSLPQEGEPPQPGLLAEDSRPKKRRERGAGRSL